MDGINKIEYVYEVHKIPLCIDCILDHTYDSFFGIVEYTKQ